MPPPLRLAILGMIPGNGHPYSWAAIVNGYDPVEMANCPYPAIPAYLGAQPLQTVRIPDAAVTHIWTDDPADAPKVARASKIPHIVSRPEDVIGHVDAAIIATDDGADHVRRARPFIQAGLPVFIDKPLATTRAELAQFIAWKQAGARILSSSGMRYAPEIQPLLHQPWHWLTAFTVKSWEKYGIHALEPLGRILGPGFLHATTHSRPGSDIVHLTHTSGAQATIATFQHALAGFGAIHAYGDTAHLPIQMKDTYTAFRHQMLAIIHWLRTGIDPYPFAETVEYMATLIAAIESRPHARPVSIPELLHQIYATQPNQA